MMRCTCILDCNETGITHTLHGHSAQHSGIVMASAAEKALQSEQTLSPQAGPGASMPPRCSNINKKDVTLSQMVTASS